jgi:hypothetical protein
VRSPAYWDILGRMIHAPPSNSHQLCHRQPRANGLCPVGLSSLRVLAKVGSERCHIGTGWPPARTSGWPMHCADGTRRQRHHMIFTCAGDATLNAGAGVELTPPSNSARKTLRGSPFPDRAQAPDCGGRREGHCAVGGRVPELVAVRPVIPVEPRPNYAWVCSLRKILD